MNKSTKRLTIQDSREKAENLLRAALAKKAINPVLMRLNRLTPITDYFLIVSGRSARHVKSIAEGILEVASATNIQAYSTEGLSQGNWVLLDYGEVIVHVFQIASRDFYDLEGLWSDAPRETFAPDIVKEIQASADIEDEDDFNLF
jgi:ribosome-associated protein